MRDSADIAMLAVDVFNRDGRRPGDRSASGRHSRRRHVNKGERPEELTHPFERRLDERRCLSLDVYSRGYLNIKPEG